MNKPLIPDNAESLAVWILVEAYKNGPSAEGLSPLYRGPDPRLVGSYFVSRHAVYQKYFGPPHDPSARPGGDEEAFAARRLASLKDAALLSKALKRLLEMRFVIAPNLGGVRNGVRQALRLFADYIFLSESGVRRARMLVGLSEVMQAN